METKEKNLIENLLSLALKAGADDAEVIIAKGQGQSAACRLGSIEAVERSEASDVGLTVYVGRKSASVSSSKTDKGSLKKMVERSISMANLAPENPFSGIASSDQIAKNWDEINMLDPYTPSPEKLIELAKETEHFARSVKGVTNSEGSEASWGKTDIGMISSNGFFGHLERSSHSLSVSVIAGKGSEMETDYDYTATAFSEDMRTPKEVGIRAGERAVSRLNSVKGKTGNYPIIFDSRVSRSIAGHLAQSINGSSVARGLSMFQDKMNLKILNSSINVIDNPNLFRGHGSVPFDGEGLVTKKRNLIKKGVLNGWLLDLASARQLNLDPTGNARRGIGGPASPGTSNFIIEPGHLTPKQLRKEIKEGLLITEFIGSSVNMITGDYSRGVSGFWIENGEITYPISEITIASNLKEMFLTMTAGNDLETSHSIIAPSLRIESMTVAGN